MFYCKTRFYVPKWRRWLNNDSSQYLDVENVGCANLYAYCNNNPVIYSDGDGHFSILALVIGLVVGLVSTGLKDYLNDDQLFNGDVSVWEYVGSGVAGMLGGAAGHAGNVLVRFVGAVGSEIVGGLISENKDYTWSYLKNNVITGLASAGIAEGLSIVGKRIAKSIYSKGFANASKNGQKQLSRFLKTGNLDITSPSAKKVISNLNKFTYGFDKSKNLTGNLYSLTVGSFGNIIEW